MSEKLSDKPSSKASSISVIRELLQQQSQRDQQEALRIEQEMSVFHEILQQESERNQQQMDFARREQSAVRELLEQQAARHRQDSVASSKQMKFLIGSLVFTVFSAGFTGYLGWRSVELAKNQAIVSTEQAKIAKIQLDDQHAKEQVEPTYRTTLEKVFNLISTSSGFDDELGFETFTRKLFEACDVEYHKKNDGTGAKGDTEYRDYGYDYTGFGPYLVSKGRGKGEIVDKTSWVREFEINEAFHVYYKLGYKSTENDARVSDGPIFLIDRLDIRIMKPRDVSADWKRILKLDPKKDRQELLRIFEHCGVLIRPFRWMWKFDASKGGNVLGVGYETMPQDAIALAKYMNDKIYGKGVVPDLLMPTKSTAKVVTLDVQNNRMKVELDFGSH